ncbi:peptidase family M1-domain-containing protein [Mortierella sp. GBAus27b]|nr:hypothetical protein BGX31_011067 [Mortierella sp. GBA43]KAI8347053.1 peptidase family M1-domain-containing protein [Mortierella sp. GBAus27b]
MAPERVVLPKNVTPTHYDIKLWPNLETFIFTGEVGIDVNVHEPTSIIKVNAKKLNIAKASVQVGEKTHVATTIEYPTDQVASFTFAHQIPEGPARLEIEFSGEHNDRMNGFYRSQYKDADGNEKYMVVTQFEPVDARQAFPCWDEPAIKATFSVTLVVPFALEALSNMPVKLITAVEPDVKTVHFEKTPIMSTYLVAFAVGDFEFIETTTTNLEKPITCRVYTLPGFVEQGRFALEITPKILEYFTEIFGIEYPLPKLDQIAFQDCDAGAMENWGLITYRTVFLLFDETTSPSSVKEEVATTVAHEIAHQWFGNLVTMEWWDHLWLNEGFATWVGTLAVNHLFPAWDTWPYFVITEYQKGLNLDSLRSSHPIEVPVSEAHEIHQIFDAISYSKGGSVIRMLSNWLTQDVFLAGIRLYLKTHTYKNASTNDLWSALSEKSGIDILEFMNFWTRVIGYPILNVTEDSPGSITVEQHRYLSTNDVKDEEDKTIWWIPLGVYPEPASIVSHSQIMKTRQLKIELSKTHDGQDFYLINKDFTGVFRTNYPPSALHQLGLGIQAGHPALGVSERAGFLADLASLAASGHNSVTRLLDLIQYYRNEKTFVVWSILLDKLDSVTQIFSANERTLEGISHFQRSLVQNLAEELGWDFPKGEDFLTSRLRSIIIARAGSSGHAGTIKEALRRFNLFAEEGADQDTILPSSTRESAFGIAIAHGGANAFNQVLKYYRTTPKQDQHLLCLRAICSSVQGEDLIQRTFEFVLSNEVRSLDFEHVLKGFSSNIKARQAIWTWIKKNWSTFQERYTGNIHMLGFCIKLPLSNVADLSALKDLEDFFADKDTKDFDRDLEQAKEGLRSRSNWVTRDGGALETWLVDHHY